MTALRRALVALAFSALAGCSILDSVGPAHHMTCDKWQGAPDTASVAGFSARAHPDTTCVRK